MHDVVIGAFYAGVVLLGFAGLTKLRDPSATSPALAALHLPSGHRAGRVLGGAELAVATAAVVSPGPAAALAVATAYTALAFAAARLARSTDVGCGCLGRHDAPATAMHVVVDALLALVAVVVAIDAIGGARAVTHGGIAGGVWLLALAAIAARLVSLTLNELPQAWDAQGRSRP